MVIGSKILDYINNTAWVITESKLETIKKVLDAKYIDNVKFEKFASMQNLNEISTEYGINHFDVINDTAVIPIVGTMMSRTGCMDAMSGFISYRNIAANISAAGEDRMINNIILDLDTPGGTVAGVDEVGAAIRRASLSKKVVAYTGGYMCSGGYWLASQADYIYASKTATIGSIGVLMMHIDQSSANAAKGLKVTYITAGDKKALGNSDESLSPEAYKHFKDSVDKTHALFIETVAEGRGMSVEAVKNVADGSLYSAAEAVENGLIDAVVGNIDDLLS